jgi:hypothetical protein
MIGLLEIFSAHAIGVNYHLGVTFAVTQVAENQAAMIAVVPSPTSKHNLTTYVLFAQLATRSSVHAVFIPEVCHVLPRFYIVTFTQLLLTHAEASHAANTLQGLPKSFNHDEMQTVLLYFTRTKPPATFGISCKMQFLLHRLPRPTEALPPKHQPAPRQGFALHGCPCCAARLHR